MSDIYRSICLKPTQANMLSGIYACPAGKIAVVRSASVYAEQPSKVDLLWYNNSQNPTGEMVLRTGMSVGQNSSFRLIRDQFVMSGLDSLKVQTNSGNNNQFLVSIIEIDQQNLPLQLYKSPNIKVGTELSGVYHCPVNKNAVIRSCSVYNYSANIRTINLIWESRSSTPSGSFIIVSGRQINNKSSSNILRDFITLNTGDRLLASSDGANALILIAPSLEVNPFS